MLKEVLQAEMKRQQAVTRSHLKISSQIKVNVWIN